ncbi:coil containing protein [Vibrio phage 1.170.O._10N.261.52.C3]|nr:coil containing protein [Vibrio phage 1.170.O._10N.261.52.C3]
MFEDIKEGDLVLRPIELKRNFFDQYAKVFYYPAKVSKVTPKRFEVNGKIYTKTDGSCVGEPHGRKVKLYSVEDDELKAYIEAKDLIVLRNKVGTTLERYDFSCWDKERLLELLRLLEDKSDES